MKRALRVPLVTFAAIVLAPSGLAAQPVIAQWGGKLVPDSRERTEFGLHFALLSEFDKDTLANGNYAFTKYADAYGTIGLNFVSYQTVREWRPRATTRRGTTHGRISSEPAHVLIAESVLIGRTGDGTTRWLQNSVIHAGRTRIGLSELLPIPRDTLDTRDAISQGPSSGSLNILQFSTSVAYRLSQFRREDGRDVRQVTPLFLGGGYSVGTLYHEAFVQGGLMDFDFRVDSREIPCIRLRLVSAGVFGVGRAGVLLPSRIFTDLTADYRVVQAGVRGEFSVLGVPVLAEFSTTGMDGFFVRPRTDAENALIVSRLGADSLDLRKRYSIYEAKSARKERYEALRLRLGNFSFQLTNDSQGGKDSGPTFSAQFTVDTHRLWPTAPTIAGVVQRVSGL